MTRNFLFSFKTAGFWISLLILSATGTQCKSQRKHSENHPKTTDVPTMAKDTITTQTLNADKSMLLEVNEVVNNAIPMADLYYKVTTTKDGSILKEDHFKGEAVRWNNTHSLKLVPYVGMEQKPQSDNPDDLLKDSGGNKPIIVEINQEKKP